MNRELGYPVHFVDAEALTDTLHARGLLHADYRVGQTAVVRTAEGLATICTEGVGWREVDGTLTVEILSGYMTQYPDIDTQIVLDHLAQDTVELSAFIRRFGSRLETNFGIWKRQIDGVPQTFEKETA